MRNLCEVIEQIKKEIPSSKKELIEEIEQIYTSAMIAPPEMQSFWWMETACALVTHVPQSLKEEWGIAIIRIWNGTQSDDDDDNDD